MPGARKKATDEQILASYAQHSNVWIVAQEFGMCGQSIHERLTKLGAINHMNHFSDHDRVMLDVLYQRHASTGTLDELASAMGRTKQFICRQAKAMDLTDRARPKPYLAPVISVRAKEWFANNPHPRGMLGKTHSDSNKAKMSVRSSARWAAMSPDERSDQTLRGMKTKAAKGALAHPKPHGSWKAEWRTIGGQRAYFRSRWEANYARYLEWLRSRGEIAGWRHEPETFWFEKIKRGVRSYLPDFEVTETSGRIAFHEVKGWMDDRSKTKIRRMKKYHPTVTLIVIDGKAYKRLAKTMAPMIAGWET